MLQDVACCQENSRCTGPVELANAIFPICAEVEPAQDKHANIKAAIVRPWKQQQAARKLPTAMNIYDAKL